MTAFANLDDLNDSLDGFFADADRELLPVAERVTPIEIPLSVFYDPCKACGGSGSFRSYSGRIVGKCFKCKGEGKLAFKTSPEQRAAGRANKAAAQGRSAASAFETFAADNAAEASWMTTAAARGFGFATSMVEAVGKFGHLTERQLAAVQKCMASDAAREVARAAEEARPKPVVDVSSIEKAFGSAFEAGIKSPTLRLDAFKFKPSKDRAAIYVRDAEDNENYFGKIVDGVFHKTRSCSAEQEATIVAAAANPAEAAKAYGFRTGTCACCGRGLTNHASIELGIGPVCATRFSF